MRTLRLELEARGIAHAGIFGSVSRDKAQSGSDIDIVVTPTKGRRLDLFDLGGVQSLLDDGFGGVTVDVVVEPIRRTELRVTIARDRVDAF